MQDETRTTDGKRPYIHLERIQSFLRPGVASQPGISVTGNYVTATIELSTTDVNVSTPFVEFFEPQEDGKLESLFVVSTEIGHDSASIVPTLDFGKIYYLDEKTKGKNATVRIREAVVNEKRTGLSFTGLEAKWFGLLSQLSDGFISAALVENGKLLVVAVVDENLDVIGNVYRTKDLKPVYEKPFLLAKHRVIDGREYVAQHKGPSTFTLRKKGDSCDKPDHFFALSYAYGVSGGAATSVVQSIQPPSLLDVWHIGKRKLRRVARASLPQYANAYFPKQNGGAFVPPNPAKRRYPSKTLIAVTTRVAFVPDVNTPVFTDYAQTTSFLPPDDKDFRMFKFDPWRREEDRLAVIAGNKFDSTFLGGCWHPSGEAFGFVKGGLTINGLSANGLSYIRLFSLFPREDEGPSSFTDFPFAALSVGTNDPPVSPFSHFVRFSNDGRWFYAFGGNFLKQADGKTPGMYTAFVFRATTNLRIGS